MSAAALTVMLCTLMPAQTSGLENLDFRTGTLKGWKGKGFYVTTATPTGPSITVGLCSSDRGGKVKTGTRRYTFTVPAGAGRLRCSAYAARPREMEADARLNILVLTESSEVLPMQVLVGSVWQDVAAVLPRRNGQAREYSWDLSGYVDQRVQIILKDDDDRPRSYLYCGPFRLGRQDETETVEFAAFMKRLQRENRLLPMKHYASKHFSAWGNAEQKFTETRLRNCETMYQLFLSHFRARGFPVRDPGARLMVAVFDSQVGFEAYLGHKMPTMVTGVYNRATNCLVLYDLQQNEAALKFRDNAFQNSGGANDLSRKEYLSTVERHITDWTTGGGLSTAMHETAHELSFNCGLLNRTGDVPLWLGEGLACYCEATDRGNWQGVGAMNHSRIRVLAEVVSGKGHFIPLKTLVESDKWRDGNDVMMGYSQSWALFRMLMQDRPEALRSYLQLIRSRRAPDHRMTDFAQIFGSDLSRLETRYHAYMTDLVHRAGPRLRQ